LREFQPCSSQDELPTVIVLTLLPVALAQRLTRDTGVLRRPAAAQAGAAA